MIEKAMATTDRESFSSQAALEVLAALRQIAESHSEDPGSPISRPFARARS
ncbi:MAG: hypothetical protein ACK5ZP_12950 [Betaproteobacteria bacterium]